MKQDIALASACLLAMAWWSLVPVNAQPSGNASPISSGPVRIVLGPPQQILRVGQFGMREVPDMHMALLQVAPDSYQVFISGVMGVGNRGSTGLLATEDLIHYSPVGGVRGRVRMVFGPSCHGPTYKASCVANWDSDYAGANYVFRASNGRDLIMIYHGETRTFGTTVNPQTPFYAEIGVARSADQGRSWGQRQAVVTGTEEQWSVNPGTKPNGIPEGSAIVANGFIYSVFPYFQQAKFPAQAPATTLQMARASVASDGAAGSWKKFYNGEYTEPGIHGRASPIVVTGGACTEPRQPWLAYSTYLKSHVLLFICRDGWFFSLSSDPDLKKWTAPERFTTPASKQFSFGMPNDDNYIFASKGEPGSVIDQSGLVLYAHTDRFGKGEEAPHELWYRTFTFETGQPDTSSLQ